MNPKSVPVQYRVIQKIRKEQQRIGIKISAERIFQGCDF